MIRVGLGDGGGVAVLSLLSEYGQPECRGGLVRPRMSITDCVHKMLAVTMLRTVYGEALA